MSAAGGEGCARLDPRLIEEVRARTSIERLAARRVTLRRSGRGWSGLCPFHEERTPSFTVSDEKGFFHCFGCGAHGDCFDWVRRFDGCDFRSAVLLLAGVAGVAVPEAGCSRASAALDARRSAAFAPAPAPPHDPRHSFVSSATAGRWIWRSSSPARGELVERYLEARGLDPRAEFLPGCAAIDQLRFHPRCPLGLWRAWEQPDDGRITAPAMVAPIRDPDGAVRGVHVTYLARDGRSKAALGRTRDGSERRSRKIFGKVGGNAVFLSGAGADAGQPPGPSAPLIIGEGIETVWAFAQGFGRPAHAIAALNLENLQGHPKRLRDGSLPLWNIQADPERPPFILPGSPGLVCGGEPGSTSPGIGEVIILIDADMKPLRDQKVQLSRGARPVRIDLDGLKRAEICVELAAQAWRRAGASKVRCIRPRLGQDFNDRLRSAA